MLNFNSEIKNLLKEKNISINDGMAYLICIHYGLIPSFIPLETTRKVLALNIITKDYSTETVKWLIPLFEESEIGFEWIKDYMQLFKTVNSERIGVKADVLRRMKKFFGNNPSVRKEEVLNATKLYLSKLENPIYCKKSHKFISEIDGSSMLLEYVEKLKENQLNTEAYKDDII